MLKTNQKSAVNNWWDVYSNFLGCDNSIVEALLISDGHDKKDQRKIS